MTTSSTPGPRPSALTTYIKSSLPADLTHARHYHYLAAQILHNLQHQHDWTSLRIHTHCTSLASQPSSLSDVSHSPSESCLLPRPIISGLPPRSLYTHPDDQVSMLKAGVKEKDVRVEREWVLPMHLREKWSLKGFGEVFDGIGLNEPDPEDRGLQAKAKDGAEGHGSDKGKEKGKSQEDWQTERRAQRVLLATLCDDSTVVYYIVHDGIVKPRQN